MRGYRVLLFIALQTLCIIPQITAGQPSMWELNAKRPVPAGAKVTLEIDRPEYFLGENVLVHFTLENTGDQPFEADFGGDYRGATRALRFKVTAVDESGQLVEDPDTSEFCGGGFGGPRQLKPGDRFSESLPLMRYCRIMRPGRYTIRVTHDYGWREGDRKRPVGEINVAFKMPTGSEAEAVVATMEKLPDSPNNMIGERARDYSDFSVIRQPIYLKPLLQRVERGNLNALEGICWIASTEATKALIDLATNKDPKLALEAARTLTARLPEPSLNSTNGFSGFPPFTREACRLLARDSWDPILAPAVRAIATNYLAHMEIEYVTTGASMISAVGTTNEAPSVRTALDRALGPITGSRRGANDDILDQPEGVRELLYAMTVLHTRGYTIDEENLRGDTAFLLYFTWLAEQPPPRPQRWLELLNAYGINGHYPIRVAALNSIPQPVPEECLGFVESRMTDDDLGVVLTACMVAGRSGNQRFMKPLLEIVATERDQSLVSSASYAAQKLGANYDLLDAWADRLADEQLCPWALNQLVSIIERNPQAWLDQSGLSNTRGGRLALRRAWKAFLARHETEIRQGKKFKADNPELSPDLIGRERFPETPN